MSELELLFLVLALVYAWECALWVPRGSLAFRTWLGRNWGLAHPDVLFGNQKGGFIWAQPLPPLGTVLTTNQFPLALSPDGVLSLVSPYLDSRSDPARSSRFFRFNDIRTVEVRGKKVLVNGQLLLGAPSSGLAEYVSRQIRRIQQTPAGKREQAIEEMIWAGFDLKAIRARWALFQDECKSLRLVTNGLFGYLFIVAPTAIWNLGFKLSWLGLLAGLIALTTPAAILFHRAHRRLYPTAADERFTHFLTILLSPATSIRANDILSRHLLEFYHPLAVAKVFCSPSVTRNFAERLWRETLHTGLSACPDANPLAQAAERHWRNVSVKVIEQFLKQNGLDPTDLARAPAPADDCCRAYCPRCLTQFTTIESGCADCGGVALVPLPGRDNPRDDIRAAGVHS